MRRRKAAAPPPASSAAFRSRLLARPEPPNDRPRRPILVRGAPPYPNPRIVTIATVEEGGFGAESAAPAVLHILEAYSQNRRSKSPAPGGAGRLMYATRTRNARPEPFTVHVGIGERLGLAHMDWPLTIAALGLIAFSVFVLGQATKNDIPGDPSYYLKRQAIYAVLGIIGMVALTRIDYSRFRELRVGIYTFLCASVSLVFVFGFAARGSRRAFELPFFSFQPSELGKLLLVLALAGFVIDGARRGSRGSARCATSASGWPRLRSSSCSPTSAPQWCSWPPPSPSCIRRRPLDAFRGHRRGSRRVDRAGPGRRSGGRGIRSSRGTRRNVSPLSSTPTNTLTARAINRTNRRSPSAPVR